MFPLNLHYSYFFIVTLFSLLETEYESADRVHSYCDNNNNNGLQMTGDATFVPWKVAFEHREKGVELVVSWEAAKNGNTWKKLCFSTAVLIQEMLTDDKLPQHGKRKGHIHQRNEWQQKTGKSEENGISFFGVGGFFE